MRWPERWPCHMQPHCVRSGPHSGFDGACATWNVRINSNSDINQGQHLHQNDLRGVGTSRGNFFNDSVSDVQFCYVSAAEVSTLNAAQLRSVLAAPEPAVLVVALPAASVPAGQYRSAVDALRSVLKAHFQNAARTRHCVVFREASPQHFRASGGVYNVAELANASSSRRECLDTLPPGSYPAAKVRLERQRLAYFAKFPDFRYLPVFDALTARGAWHVGRGVGEHGDCTHWCQPGPVHAWNQLLFHLLDGCGWLLRIRRKRVFGLNFVWFWLFHTFQFEINCEFVFYFWLAIYICLYLFPLLFCLFFQRTLQCEFAICRRLRIFLSQKFNLPIWKHKHTHTRPTHDQHTAFAMSLKVGDSLPDFTLFATSDSGPAPTSRSALLTSDALVLLAVPFAFTGVCTRELCDANSRLDRFAKLDATVVGISGDSVFSLAKWRELEQIKMQLISDYDHTREFYLQYMSILI